jgi:TolB-like protein/Flp pilus assembly protein TadD
MPFRNLSADQSKAYFSDGLAEELRALLSLNRQIEVAAQSSSNSLRDAGVDARAVAKKLDVGFVLEGSVQTAGEQLRIIARLVDGQDGFEKWSQVFDRTYADVLAVQSEIATMVTDALVSTMLDSGKGKTLRIGGTDSPKAFDAYLRGAALYDQAQDEPTFRLALAAFDEAVGLDPRYAVAHAARARALTAIGSSYASGADELAEWNARALAAARKSVELAPELAEGQAALGFILMYGGLDLAAASQPMEQSYQRGFGNAAILSAYATFVARLGAFDKARAVMLRAKRLNPLDSTVWRISGQNEFWARNFAGAEADLERALSLNPKMRVAHWILGDIALVRKDVAGAERHYRLEPSTLSRLRGLAVAAWLRGDKAAAQREFDRLIADFGDNSLYQQAQILAQWGERERAFAALERAYAIRDSGLLMARGDPMLDPIRQDPRFAAVLHRLGADRVQG